MADKTLETLYTENPVTELNDIDILWVDQSGVSAAIQADDLSATLQAKTANRDEKTDPPVAGDMFPMLDSDDGDLPKKMDYDTIKSEIQNKFTLASWVTATIYTVGQLVKKGNTIYICITQHTSGTFTTDWLTNSYWVPVGDAPGTIKAWGSATAPAGYLLCNNASLLRADYADLFAVLGTTYGSADGTHFNVPDTRGIFLKGAGTTDRATGKDGAGAYYTATHGAYVTDKFQSHKHAVAVSTQMSMTGGSANVVKEGGSLNSAVPKTDGVSTVRTGNFTEPAHVVVTYIIKY